MKINNTFHMTCESFIDITNSFSTRTSIVENAYDEASFLAVGPCVEPAICHALMNGLHIAQDIGTILAL